MEKMKITNSSQFEKLVDELKKNPSLARGFRRGTVPNDFKEQWERIATALNDLGPPNRTGDGWQKVLHIKKFFENMLYLRPFFCRFGGTTNSK